MTNLGGNVLITGGTGSLGQAILARAEAEGWPAQFTVYSRDEVKQAQLRDRFPSVECRLGDVQDEWALERAMRGTDVVVHAAAYKRVPEAERETQACVGANVVGSMNVLNVAARTGVQRVVGISTDKACAPINAYGQSKALMERLFQSAARQSTGITYHLVRYGNVLASRGSVIPTLRAQAERGGPITLTDPTMTRFWLTLDDAVDLVVQSLELDSGEVLIPRCPAASMATLAGVVAPGVEVVVLGRRDGEKRHELLMNEHESPYARPVPGGWALLPLTRDSVGELPRGFAYGSGTAPQLRQSVLGGALEAMALGRPARVLP